MSDEVQVHALTGHECVYPRPDGWPLPKTFTVSVYPSEAEGEGDVWYADIKGACPDGKPFDQLTFGETPTHALAMALDVVRMLFDECSVAGAPPGRHDRHCYCRDVTAGGAWPQPFAGTALPRAAKQCCRCEQVTALSEFGESPKHRWPCPGAPVALAGQPLGMYHCEYCGEMQLAGTPHLPPQNPEDWEEPFPKIEKLEEP